MEVTAIGAAILLLACLSVFAGRLAGAALLGATIPLSASAAIILGWAGGATILCAIIAAIAIIARAGLEVAVGALNGEAVRIGAAGAFLIAFVVVAVTGAFALPRLFTGATEIYAMDRTIVGVTSGVMRFPLTPLAPHAGNITQSVYLIISAALCLSAAHLTRRDHRFPGVVLWSATISQAVFAVADLTDLAVLDHFRTATYAIAPNQSFAGFTRLIGGATEPSFFGGVSVALCAWHLWRHWLFGRAVHFLAGVAMAVFAVASLSSTAVAVLCAVAIAYGAARLINSRSIGAFGGAFLLSAALIAAASWLALGSLSARLHLAGDALFLGKLASESGVERSAWAHQALRNLVETSGLGAGLGASRASGWAAAVLGQTGAPGAILACGFLVATFARPLSPDGAAIRAGALALLAAALLSASRVDLGPLFFVMAGSAMASAGTLRHRPVSMRPAANAFHPV